MSPNAEFWLAMIAIAQAVQALLVVAAAVTVFLGVRAMRAKVEEIQREQINPLVARANHVIGEAQDVVRRARTVTDDVRHRIDRVQDQMHAAASMVRTKASPLVGIVKGARAAITALANGRDNGGRVHLDDDGLDEARFMNEGGTHHAR